MLYRIYKLEPIEGERLYVQYNMDVNIVKYLWYEW